MLKVVAIFAVVLAVAQAPVPATSQASRKSSAIGQEQNNGGNSSKNPTNPSSPVVTKNPTNDSNKAESQEAPSRNEYSTITVTNPVPEPESWSWHDKITWFADLVLAVVGVLTLIAVWKQANRMGEHSTHLQSVAGSAAKNAEAALLNAQVLIESERAWLAVTMGAVKLEPELANPNMQVTFWMHPTVANHGRTPARLTRMYLRYRLCKSITKLPFVPVYEMDDDDPSDDGSSCFDGELLIVPNSAISPLGVPLDNEDARTVRAGDITLILYGYIRYEINGVAGETTRFTRFIFRYDLADKASPIPEGFHFPTGLPEYNRAT
jgi:hypothetical protein